MPALNASRRWAIALLAAAAALGAACALSAGLRRADARVSHQVATPEAWPWDSARASPQGAGRGRKLFLGSCAHCHGADATGDEGPDLHGVEVSDRYIARVIARGIKGEMPSFAKKLGRADIADLTAYLRSLD